MGKILGNASKPYGRRGLLEMLDRTRAAIAEEGAA